VETIKKTKAVWQRAKVRECWLGLQPRMNADPVCDATASLGWDIRLRCYMSDKPFFNSTLQWTLSSAPLPA